MRRQRGQLEVSARYQQLMHQPLWQRRVFSPAITLLVDHTLAFPRIVWTFLLPILALFGYPLSLIVMAFLVLYGFYLLIDIAWVFVAWLGVNTLARRRLLDFLWLLPVMPFYRMVVFWFRISGFLHAVAEPGTWRVQDPLVQLKQGLVELDELTGNVFGKVPATFAVLQERFTGRKPGEPPSE